MAQGAIAVDYFYYKRERNTVLQLEQAALLMIVSVHMLWTDFPWTSCF